MPSVRATLSLLLLALAGCGADTPPDTPAEAVINGHVVALRALLDAGTDVDFHDEDERTLLHLAATHGHEDVAVLLLERGAVVDARDRQGRTPLHAAADAVVWTVPTASSGLRLKPPRGDQHGEVASALLAAGADVGARDEMEATPLHEAARSGNVAVARELIKHGADVGAATDSGVAPLHRAVQVGRMDGFDISTAQADYPAMVRLLLAHGADPNAPSWSGTPLAEAVKHSRLIVNLLVERGGNPTSTRRWKAQDGEAGLKPVHSAARAGAVDVLAAFLDLGVMPDETDRGRTLLELAAGAGQEDAVRLLLTRGASIERAGTSTMLAAAHSGDVGTLKLLREHGGDIHAQVDGNTLLHAAAARYVGGLWMVRYLISEGLDANAHNDEGLTPLEVAERNGAHSTPGALRWYSGPGRYEWAYLLAIGLLSAGLGTVVARRKGYAGVLGAILGVTLLGLVVTAALPRRLALPENDRAEPGPNPSK